MVDGQPPLNSPIDDFQVLTSRIDAVEDSVDQQISCHNQRVQLAEIIVSEFAPAADAFKMFQSFVAEELRPIDAVPFTDGPLAEIVPLLLAFDPLMPFGFLERLFVDAQRQGRLTIQIVFHGRVACDRTCLFAGGPPP